MAEEVWENEAGLLRDMKQKIQEVEKLVIELNALGKGVPVVEKNTQCILSFIDVLKFGISDVVEAIDF